MCMCVVPQAPGIVSVTVSTQQRQTSEKKIFTIQPDRKLKKMESALHWVLRARAWFRMCKKNEFTTSQMVQLRRIYFYLTQVEPTVTAIAYFAYIHTTSTTNIQCTVFVVAMAWHKFHVRKHTSTRCIVNKRTYQQLQIGRNQFFFPFQLKVKQRLFGDRGNISLSTFIENKNDQAGAGD